MANRKVSIYILASYNGRRRWFKPTYRGRLPKLETVIEGKAQPLPNGVFYLRHGSGKDRNWDRISNQGDVALNALQRQSQRLAAKAAGLALADEPDKAPRIPLAQAYEDFLNDLSIAKSKATVKIYKALFKEFGVVCPKQFVDEILMSQL
jgi:hypothetical protein